jgi:hypothetical protein
MARQGICMMHSAALGVQDMVKNNISQVGEMMTTRRDALLEKMRGKNVSAGPGGSSVTNDKLTSKTTGVQLKDIVVEYIEYT